jgi:hypothetical protein
MQDAQDRLEGQAVPQCRQPLVGRLERRNLLCTDTAISRHVGGGVGGYGSDGRCSYRRRGFVLQCIKRCAGGGGSFFGGAAQILQRIEFFGLGNDLQ